MFHRKESPKEPWSRPLSEISARSTFESPPAPKEIPGPKLLLVGGNYSFVPRWISENLTFKHFQYSKENFYDVLGNFEPDAIILFVKATDGHTKHQTFDYGRLHNVPVLVLHTGWSHLVDDAKRKGVDWLAALYPYKIYITDEDREKRRKRRSKKSSKKSSQRLAYDEKRRQAFAEAGIRDTDARFSETRYIRPKVSNCVLCGTKIKYQYGIDFTLPGKVSIISFFPVGSNCIRSWLKSLPDVKYLDRMKHQTEAEINKAEPPKPTQLDFGWD